jgi:hypothetical protein
LPQVAVKIVNHVKSDPGKAVRDIRVLRETLFSTALLHPNIVVVSQPSGPEGDRMMYSQQAEYDIQLYCCRCC